jgi:hypothetical protein
MRIRILALLSSFLLTPMLLSAQDTQTRLPDPKILWEFDTGG